MLLPSMPIPDRFLRAATRCWPRQEDWNRRRIFEPHSRENGLLKGATILAMRKHVAKMLVDSSKLPLTGKCKYGTNHPNHFVWSKRAMPFIMNRIFYGHQDSFNATHLLGEMD
jgi:hypothetical protein